MSGGGHTLSAGVRRLRQNQTFGSGSADADLLNSLTGSLDRYEAMCEEALAAISGGGKERGDGGVTGDDDLELLELYREDYGKRFAEAEKTAGMSGGRGGIKAEKLRLEDAWHFYKDFKQARIRKVKLKGLVDGEAGKNAAIAEQYANLESKFRNLEKAIAYWETLLRCGIPSGESAGKWPVARIRAFSEAAKEKKGELESIRKWAEAVRKELEGTGSGRLAGLAEAKEELAESRRGFANAISSCIKSGRQAKWDGMSEEMKAFIAREERPDADTALKLNLMRLGDEARRHYAEKHSAFMGGIGAVASCQPELRNVQDAAVNPGAFIPSYICLGDGAEKIEVCGEKVDVPVQTAFPLPGMLTYADAGDVNALILRLAHCLPRGMLQVKVLDSEKFGMCAKPISRLAGIAGIEIAATGPDIDAALDEMAGYAADLVREGRFSDGICDWAAYNRANQADALPYRILVAASYGTFSEEQATTLKKIARLGREIGICVLAPEESAGEMAGECGKLAHGAAPAGEELEKYVEVVEAVHALLDSRPQERKKAVADLYAGGGFWTASAADGLEARLGFAAGGVAVSLRLGGENNHVLLGGTTGSGKSNLIHILLHSLCHDYSPEELRLYLLDFKDGLEFGKYTEDGRAWLPHVETVSVHNDPSYAISMFDYVQRECLRRRNEFAGARSYGEYRRTGGKMPRIVIVVDEFHKLFETPQPEEMSARLTQVLKQGRAYGVHMVLATQTLASSEIPNLAGMLGQIPVRLALRGAEGDMILEPDNMAATGISIPKCVYNDRFGRRGGNVLFDVPEAVFDGGFKEGTAMAMSGRGSARGMGSVFNGTKPPRTTAEDFAAILAGKEDEGVVLCPGQENAFCGGALTFAFENSPTGHLLIAAAAGDGAMDDNGFMYRDEAADSIRDCIRRSLAVRSDIAALYYNPRKNIMRGWNGINQFVCPASAPDAELRECIAKLATAKCRHKVFFVDDYEHANLLHPKTDSFSYTDGGNGETESASSAFAEAFRNAGPGAIRYHVIAVTRNFRHVSENLMYDHANGVNMLRMFAHRISVDLPLDDVQTLFPSYLRRDVRGKILYGSNHSDEVRAFLPYAIEERKK